MSPSFLKPLDYSLDLIIKMHPSIREYQSLRRQTEVDPDYHLASAFLRERQEPRDELQLRNNLAKSQVTITNMNRSVAGAFVNTMDVMT